MTGRGTAWKWRRLWAILAALVALVGAWLTARPETITHAGAALRRRLEHIPAETWIELPWEGGTCALAGDTLITAGDGRIAAFDLKGETLWQTETDISDPVIRVWQDRAAVYGSGGNVLILADRDGAETLAVPTGVDLAIPVPEGAAVVTAGSGYLTETVFYDRNGAETGSIGLTDRATVMMACLENGTIILCQLSATGKWFLQYGVEPEPLTVPLEAELVYDMKPCGAGIALWTCDGFRFFDESGRETGFAALAEETVLDWACGDLAAVLVREGGETRLALAAPDGTVSESEALPGAPMTVAVRGETVCLLDREAMLIYDRSGVRVETCEAGARAAHILSGVDGVVLVSADGLFRHLIS